MEAEIGIIGGSGLYSPDLMEGVEAVKVYTPYGDPSDFIYLGWIGERKVAFLPRHGKGHRIPPHMINYRANVWAMKSLGVKRILAPSAVGSLQEGIKPGDFVIPDQFIDMTKGRKYTFYDGGKVAHVSLADPFCPELRRVIAEGCRSLGLNFHANGTYVCIEGPRFSTRAESALFKSWGAHVIGMTLVPEVNLAREAEICYATIAMVTDYDVWAERPVSASEVAETMAKNVDKVRLLIKKVVPEIPKERRCSCGEALKDAVI